MSNPTPRTVASRPLWIVASAVSVVALSAAPLAAHLHALPGGNMPAVPPEVAAPLADYAVVAADPVPAAAAPAQQPPAPEAAPEPAPVPAETEVPAAPAPPATPEAPAVPSGSVWDALAQCESNGNWAMNSGNGFHGGIQFMHSTWVSMGGRQWAEYPHEATREQQIEVASRLQAQSGWGQWPACTARLGLY